MKKKDVLIAVILVAVVMSVFSYISKRPRQNESVAQTPLRPDFAPASVTLEVAGRPRNLDEVLVTAKFRSRIPVELCFCKGRPLGCLSVTFNHNLNTVDFSHTTRRDPRGGVPSIMDPYPIIFGHLSLPPVEN